MRRRANLRGSGILRQFLLFVKPSSVIFSAVFYYGMCTWMAESRNDCHSKKGTVLNGRSEQQYEVLIVGRFENNRLHPATSASEAAAIDEFAIEKFLPLFSTRRSEQRATSSAAPATALGLIRRVPRQRTTACGSSGRGTR